MICPYSFDEPIGSGVPSLLDGRYWCMGWIALGMSARRHRCPEDCPVDFGPWGTWRSCITPICQRFALWIDEPDPLIQDITALYLIFFSDELLAAVGWST